MAVKEAPETVVLLTQREVYALAAKRENLQKAVDDAQKVLSDAISAVTYNEAQIKECVEFLQEQCPDAVKGTWAEEMEI